MKSVTTAIVVEWGHCDPAGLVFYPNFFTFFDHGSWNLFIDAGLTLDVLRSEFGAFGFPAVNSQADFKYPCRQMDKLLLTSTMEEVNEKTFVISHSIHNGEMLAVNGREVRVLGVPHPEQAQRIQAGIIPPELAARFAG